VVNAKGDGPAVDVSIAANRVFCWILNITNIIEQESLDVSILVSRWRGMESQADRDVPQKFYRAQHPMLLDVIAHPEIKIRTRSLGGQSLGAAAPRLRCSSFTVSMREVPTEILKEATADAKALA